MCTKNGTDHPMTLKAEIRMFFFLFFFINGQEGSLRSGGYLGRYKLKVSAWMRKVTGEGKCYQDTSTTLSRRLWSRSSNKYFPVMSLSGSL